MQDLIGQFIGSYHVLEQLGEGGMATVYKAIDTTLKRQVAIKIIRRDAFPPNQFDRMLKRFQQEVIVLARLSHPNIVKMLDYGEYQGSPYLVMPYFSGGTLRQQLHGKPMPYKEAARILMPITNGLTYAHGLGMIHRDVKTSNILIDNSGSPLLTDFGISKIITDETTFDITATSAIVGTPEYMAPEQWIGQTSPQSDIYSLGIVFYELITGRKPYIANSPSAVMLKQATEPIPRPGQYVRDLPEVVEKLLLKALARKPEIRYQNMATFARELASLYERQKDFDKDKNPKHIGKDHKPQYVDEEKVIIQCEYCYQKLRIPKHEKKIRIACPICRHEFDYPYKKMIICPHCSYLNPKQRGLCVNCGKTLNLTSRRSKIVSGIYYIVGGVLLIALDNGSGWHSGISGIIGIPLVLSIIGVIVIILGIRLVITHDK